MWFVRYLYMCVVGRRFDFSYLYTYVCLYTYRIRILNKYDMWQEYLKYFLNIYLKLFIFEWIFS